MQQRQRMTTADYNISSCLPSILLQHLPFQTLLTEFFIKTYSLQKIKVQELQDYVYYMVNHGTKDFWLQF